jgi:hypothetical protein
MGVGTTGPKGLIECDHHELFSVDGKLTRESGADIPDSTILSASGSMRPGTGSAIWSHGCSGLLHLSITVVQRTCTSVKFSCCLSFLFLYFLSFRKFCKKLSKEGFVFLTLPSFESFLLTFFLSSPPTCRDSLVKADVQAIGTQSKNLSWFSKWFWEMWFEMDSVHLHASRRGE